MLRRPTAAADGICKPGARLVAHQLPDDRRRTRALSPDHLLKHRRIIAGLQRLFQHCLGIGILKQILLALLVLEILALLI